MNEKIIIKFFACLFALKQNFLYSLFVHVNVLCNVSVVRLSGRHIRETKNYTMKRQRQDDGDDHTSFAFVFAPLRCSCSQRYE